MCRFCLSRACLPHQNVSWQAVSGLPRMARFLRPLTVSQHSMRLASRKKFHGTARISVKSLSWALLTMTKLGGKEHMSRAMCILAAAFWRLCFAQPMLKAVSWMVVEPTARMVRVLNRCGSPG